MAELDQLLFDTEATHRKMFSAFEREGIEGVPEIVELRTRFAGLSAELLAAIQTDQRMAADPLFANEFEDRFLTVRKKLAEHQSQWRGGAIEEDFAGYSKSVRELARLQSEFYLWAQVALARA